MCSPRQKTIVASLTLLAATLLAAPILAAPASQTMQTEGIILPPPCELEPCDECFPAFVLTHRQVLAIEFVKKKDNGVCVYECDANDTFTDVAQCPGSEDFTTPVGFRVRPFFGSFPCPGDPAHPEAGQPSPGFCCDTEPRPASCSW